eukprot:8298291-Pyramimonas_sp.AAC.1
MRAPTCLCQLRAAASLTAYNCRGLNPATADPRRPAARGPARCNLPTKAPAFFSLSNLLGRLEAFKRRARAVGFRRIRLATASQTKESTTSGDLKPHLSQRPQSTTSKSLRDAMYLILSARQC